MSESDEIASTPDDQLMLAFADGDPGAFDKLYERHETQLLHFVRRLLGLSLSGETDLVYRQTWGQIIDERRNFSPLDTWVVWALGIAHARAVERLRRTGRDISFQPRDARADADEDGLEAARLYGRRLQRDDGFGGSDDDQMAEVERVFWGAAGQRLLACIERLPEDERAAFLLYQEDRFTIEALAETMRFDDQTVRTLLRRGLQKLRDGMETYLAVLGGEHGIDDEREEDELLRDPHLQRALAYAPDAGSVPEWETRNALLAQAHEGAGLDEAFERQSGSASLLQPRSLDGSGSGHGLRWAGLAVVVAAVGGWFWLRNPTPIARVEQVTQVAVAPSVSTPEPAANSKPAAAQAPAPVPAPPVAAGTQGNNPQTATPPAAVRAPAVAAAPLPVPPAAVPSAGAAADARPDAKAAKAEAAAVATARTEQAARPAAPPALALPPVPSPVPAQSPSTSTSAAAPAPPPPAPTIPPAPAPAKAAAPAPSSAPPSTGSRLVLAPIPGPDPAPGPSTPPASTAPAAAPAPTREPAKPAAPKSVVVGVTPQDGGAPAAPRTDANTARARQKADSAVAMVQVPPQLGDAPRAPVANAAAAAPPLARTAPPTVRTDETDPPTFNALSQWTRLTISRRGGPSRTVQRADSPDLISLLGSAAIAAVGPRPLTGTPDWRITLERNNEVLAVFEVAATQVRWREGHAPPATGVPSGLALAGLRVALSDAMQESPAAPAQSSAVQGSAAEASATARSTANRP